MSPLQTSHFANCLLVCPIYQTPLTFRAYWKTYLLRLILKRAEVVELAFQLFTFWFSEKKLLLSPSV